MNEPSLFKEQIIRSPIILHSSGMPLQFPVINIYYITILPLILEFSDALT